MNDHYTHRIARLFYLATEEPKRLRQECEQTIASIEAKGTEADWRERGIWEDARMALPHLIRLEKLMAATTPQMLPHCWGAIHALGPGIAERERNELPLPLGDIKFSSPPQGTQDASGEDWWKA